MPEDVLAVRARLDAAVEGLTVPKVFQRTVRAHGDVPALRWKEGGGGELTYAAYAERVRHVALGMRDRFGLQRGDMVNLLMRNIPQFHVVDTAAAHLGCTATSIYNTYAPDQIAYIAGHSEARVAVVEN